MIFLDNVLGNFGKYIIIIVTIMIFYIIAASEERTHNMHPDLSAVDSTFCGNDYCKKLLEKYIESNKGE